MNPCKWIFIAVLAATVAGDTEILLREPPAQGIWLWHISESKISEGGGWNPPSSQKQIYTVCDVFTVAKPRNWLRTPFIPLRGAKLLYVKMGFLLRNCPVRAGTHCKKSLGFYVYHTDDKLPDPDPTVINYKFVEDIVPEGTLSEPGEGKEFVYHGKVVTKLKGLYLAFKDEGACTSIRNFTAGYKYCPEQGRDLGMFPRTIAPADDADSVQREGRCSDLNSVSQNKSVGVGVCLSSGKWNITKGSECLCRKGYELVQSLPNSFECKECKKGLFKSIVSNSECGECPQHSVPNPTKTSCTCTDGFYALMPLMPCETLPLAPLYASASIVTTTHVTIRWIPRNSVNRTLRYSIDCFTCKSREDTKCRVRCGSTVQFQPSQDNISNASLAVDGLQPSSLYLFRIYSVNELSKQEKDRDKWKYATVVVLTKEAPVVSVSPQTQTVIEGETSNISCKASGVPHPKLSWKFENGELPTDAVITITSNQSLLLLPKTAKSMEGWYQCIAKNEAGEESSNSTLHVLGLQEQRPAIEWYYIVGPLSAVALSALIVWYLCKRRMTATARSQGAAEEHEMEVLNVEVDSWEIARRQIALEEVIGSGAFGTVWRATLSRENGKPGIRFVAAKCFSPTSGDEGKVALMREIGLGKLIGDSPQPNIVQFIGCVTTQIQPILIMEYLPCGDLLGYLRKSRGIFDKHYCGKLAVAPLKTYDLMSFSNQIATGMVFLASRGIIHRDLAARNVLLDQNRVCKVTDFGLSYQNFKYGHGNAKKGCMPIKWTAPEILFGDPANLSSKSDVWSYGVVLYEIFTVGGIPYPGWSEGKTMEELKRGYRMPKPAHIANNLYNLMEMCWQEVPILRPDFVNISKRLRSFIEGEYLPLVDESKYDGAKYSRVEDVGAAAEDDARAVRGATNANASRRKWSSMRS